MEMNFENWYNKILVENEIIATAEISTTIADKTSISDPIDSSQSREDIMSDVDSIITQLNQLSARVKEDFNIDVDHIDESLLLEGAWDDTKSSFGTLFSDPVFQLVGLGIAGVLGAIGLSVKAVKDTKRNKQIGTQVMGDYGKLKQLKMQEVKLEAIQYKLEEQKEEIEADVNDSILHSDKLQGLHEADPKQQSNTQVRSQQLAQKEKDAKAQAAAAAKTAAKKTTLGDKDTAKQKMADKLEVQINAITKKRDAIEKTTSTFEQALDNKYAEDKISGFGSEKVRRLISSAKDGVAREISEARLKFFSENLSDSAKAELEESIKNLREKQNKRDEEINKEAEENAKKAKEIAAEDEETRNALNKIEKGDSEDSTDFETSTDSTDSTGSNTATDAAAAQLDKDKKDAEDAEKYKTQRSEADKKKQDKEKEDQDSIDKNASKNTKGGKLSRIEDMIKKEEDKASKNPETEKIKSKIEEYEKGIQELKNKEKKDKGDQDKIDMLSTAINSEKNKLSKTGSEKLDKLKKLRDEIAAKESWQLEGTELGRLYEMEISKLEAEYMINESTNMTVANKFRLLLG